MKTAEDAMVLERLMESVERDLNNTENVNRYRVFRKKCVFFPILCKPSIACVWLQVLNAMRVYSHSYWLAIF